MPYSREHKQNTRKRIVSCARRLFTTKGFSEVSIDEVMAEAGLTRGGFYNHFKNKDELFAEAIATVMDCDGLGNQGPSFLDFSKPPNDIARQFVDTYLSAGHLATGDTQCPLIALPSDVARGGPAVKAGYQKLFEGMVGIFERTLPPIDNRPSRDRAYALAATCVGGMVLARAMGDPAVGDSIRAAALIAAHETLDSDAAKQADSRLASNRTSSNGTGNGAGAGSTTLKESEAVQF